MSSNARGHYSGMHLADHQKPGARLQRWIERIHSRRPQQRKLMLPARLTKAFGLTDNRVLLETDGRLTAGEKVLITINP